MLYSPVAFDLSIGNDDVFIDYLEKKHSIVIKASSM